MTLCLFSCSLVFEAYVRNMTKENAIMDVFLLNTKEWPNLPNQVKTAPRLINFKSGYKRYFDERQKVTWIDINHFQVQIKSGSSIDLSDVAGRFVNSYPTQDVRVIVSTRSKIDTLLNRHRDYRDSLFGYKYKAFRPILYYDIK